MTTTHHLWIIAVGLLASVFTTHAGSIAYTYDNNGRLTTADYGGVASITYTHDANGNILQRTTTADGTFIYTLIYRAGTGGSVDGQPVVTQQVAAGESGTAASAVVEDTGADFRRWSDGNTDATRTDTNVQADLDVTAQFRSTGGADLDWYSARGIAPDGGETWADVDARPVPAKGTTLREENLADTDPDDPDDRFEILAIDPGPPPVITFRPGSTNRLYTLHTIDDLVSGIWTNVPSAGPLAGQGEGPSRQDTLTDENDPPTGPFYRVTVKLP